MHRSLAIMRAAQVNGLALKLVKVEGAFPSHLHEHDNVLFPVWKGEVRLEFRDHTVFLRRGEGLVVEKGVEHRSMANAEAQILLFEPVDGRTTGSIMDKTFTAPQRVGI